MYVKNRQNSFIGGFNISIEEDSTKRYLVLNVEEKSNIISYQVEMIKRNHYLGINEMEERIINNNVKFYYLLAKKISLRQYIEEVQPDVENSIKLMDDIASTLLESKKYLLYDSSFLLHEEYIYINPDTREVSLIYVPLKLECDVNDNFRILLKKVLGCFEKIPLDVKNYNAECFFNINEFHKKIKEMKYCVIKEKTNKNEKSKPFKLETAITIASATDSNSDSNEGIEEKADDKDVYEALFGKAEEEKKQSINGNKKQISIFIIVQAMLALVLGIASPWLNSLGNITGGYGGVSLIIVAFDLLLLKRLFKGNGG